MRPQKKPVPVPAECAKRCSCGAAFTHADLIRSPSLTPVGMLHLDGEDPSTAMYCFTHTRWSCRTTFGLPVRTFRDDLHEEIPPRCLSGTAACGGHCAHIDDLEICENECALAPYRRFLLERLVPRK
ncbi:MAG: hypothetical protein ACXWLM_01190 [Myxococcales bacterium]